MGDDIKKEIVEDMILGFGFLIFALVLFFIIIPLQVTPQAGERIASNTFPNFAVIALAIVAVGFIYDAYVIYKKYKKNPTEYELEKKESLGKIDWLAFSISIGIFLLYVLCLYLFGFIISTMLFLVLSMRWFEVGSILKCLVIAFIVVAVLSIIFQTFMLIRLPRGILIKMLLKLYNRII